MKQLQKPKMVASTRQTSSTMLPLAPVTHCSLLWRLPSSSISPAGDLLRNVWPSSILDNYWTHDGDLPMRNFSRQNRRSRHHSSRTSSTPATTLSKEVSGIDRGDYFVTHCNSIGFAGAFGATIVYPIDMGKLPFYF